MEKVREVGNNRSGRKRIDWVPYQVSKGDMSSLIRFGVINSAGCWPKLSIKYLFSLGQGTINVGEYVR